jgi:hypothetical protein
LKLSTNLKLSMAAVAKRLPENVAAISSDATCMTAMRAQMRPKLFAITASNRASTPAETADETRALMALVACPTAHRHISKQMARAMMPPPRASRKTSISADSLRKRVSARGVLIVRR